MGNTTARKTTRGGIVALLLLVGMSFSAAAQSPRTLVVHQGRLGVTPEEGGILSRAAGLDVSDVTVPEALTLLSAATGASVAFSPSSLPARQLVSCHCKDASIAEALDRILSQTEFGYLELGDQIVIARRALGGILDSVERLPVRVALASLTESDVGNRSVVWGTSWVPSIQATGSLVGSVTDAATGRPLSGVQVFIEESNLGVLTNQDGRYILLRVPAGTHQVKTLYLGYRGEVRTVTMEEGETVALDFALAATPIALDEMVVTVTGEQRRREVGHAVGTIRDAEAVVREAPVRQLTDLLEGRVAGVQVAAGGGMTGESAPIRIRGINSISVGNDPLVIVDGVRIDASSASTGSWGVLSGRLNDLNVDEIESIEIAKGPAAATLYGTDAANGVIQITTKRGRPGPAQWNVHYEAGVFKPSVSFDRYDNFRSTGTFASTGQSGTCLLYQMAAGDCTQEDLAKYNVFSDPNESVIGTGVRSRFGVQVSGGTADLAYFLSTEYEDETGYLRLSDQQVQSLEELRGESVPDWQRHPNALEKLNLRGNFSAKIGETANVQVSTSLITSHSRIPLSSVLAYGLWSGASADEAWWGGRTPELYFSQRQAQDLTRFTAGVSGTWNPLSWLSTRGTVGTDFSSTLIDALLRNGEGYGDSFRQLTNSDVNLLSIDLGASALVNPRDWLSSRTSLGVQLNRRVSDYARAYATDLPPSSETVSGAPDPTGAEGHVESVVAGAYLEQTWGFNERLFLTAAVRADGGSSFGEDLNTTLYPKASASWVISEEPFFPEIAGLNDLRLRVAYGQSGVQPGSTDALDLVSRFSTTVDGTARSASILNRLGNPDLKPERQEEYEIGTETHWLDGRINGELTYYHRTSTDGLMSYALPPSVGVPSVWVNVGSIRNSGWEALLDLDLVRNETVSWGLTLNGSVNNNEIEDLGMPGVDYLGNFNRMNREGYPVYSVWGVPIVSYDDANGDGLLSMDEVVMGDTLEYQGPSTPPRQVTALTSLDLLGGRIRLSSLFDYRGGHASRMQVEMSRCGGLSTCSWLHDPSTSLENQARAISVKKNRQTAGLVDDASYTRWRELSATYRFSEAVAQRVGASQLSLTLTGRNLWLWTKYDGFDPELVSQPGNMEGVMDNAGLPQSRYWLVRIDASF